jgi:hypothetical protein
MSFQKYFLLALSVAASSSFAFAQPRHPVIWEAKPKLHAVADSFKKEPAVFILEERRIEMQNGDEGYEQYYTTHHIIRLNDNKGAEAFNTFNIPVIPGTKLHDIKARTILPNGKVIEVSRDKIRKIRPESGMPEYLLAMEAVEPGAEVEVLYTELLPGSAAGREIFQFKVPVQQAVFQLIVPDHMVYQAKGYNGFPSARDSFMGDQRSYSAVAFGIPALDEESNSRYRAFLKRIDYKLSYVLRTDNEKERRQSWNEMAKTLYRRYIDISDKELRPAKALLKKMDLTGSDDAKKIIAIEDYLKTNISISGDLSDENAEDFEQTVRRKMSTEKGFVRLFAACLKAADIRYETGMVGNRYTYEMDDSLEMWSNLAEYCFYFPELHTYLAPAAITYRYPFVPFQMCGTRGVFTKTKVSGGSLRFSEMDVRAVPHSGVADNSVSVDADVHFDGKDLTPVVSSTWAFKGNSAGGLLQGFIFSPKEKERELVQGLLGLSDKPSDMQRYKVENVSFNDLTNGKPLTVSATIQSPMLMEKAGPKYLFKAGALIGKQVEMYADNDRKLPVEIEYPNEQPRTLRIAIPAGYRIVNPEVLRYNIHSSKEGQDVCGFSSDYKMEGSNLLVTIREFYGQTSYPLSKYEEYRKVVNAAADFNKAVLVLQKM